MVALVTSIVFLVLGVLLIEIVGRRRPIGTLTTWGEAMVGAFWVFTLAFVAYGVVPHQWLTMADNEWNWRSDRFVSGPGAIVERLPFEVTYRALRDIVVVGIYVAMVAGMLLLWARWQKRGMEKPKALAETSAFGRPLVKKA